MLHKFFFFKIEYAGTATQAQEESWLFLFLLLLRYIINNLLSNTVGPCL